MCERLKQAVLKTAIPERVSGVQIPLPPPLTRLPGRNLRSSAARQDGPCRRYLEHNRNTIRRQTVAASLCNRIWPHCFDVMVLGCGDVCRKMLWRCAPAQLMSTAYWLLHGVGRMLGSLTRIANGIAGENQLDPPVLLPAFRRVVRSDRHRFARLSTSCFGVSAAPWPATPLRE
jgi:hypothetical protein